MNNEVLVGEKEEGNISPGSRKHFEEEVTFELDLTGQMAILEEEGKFRSLT